MQALRWIAMPEGTWTIRPCPRREVRRLATALGVGEATASVLVRRGYGDHEEARALMAADPPGHDTFLLGDVEAASVLPRAEALSPVPGGVGPITDVWLLRNALEAARVAG